MNAVLLSLLIVAVPPATSTEDRHPGVTEVFGSTFDELTDCDYDGWPDRWTRRSGPGFPLYNKILLCEQSPPDGGRSLRLELDGGGAVAYSPPVTVSPCCDYLLEAYVKTEGLRHDQVFLSLGIVNEEGRTLQTFSSDPIPGSPAWTRLRLGPVSPVAAETRSAIIGLHLEPGAKEDMKGCAMFGGIWLGRLPRMTLAADTPTRLYTDPKRVAVTCAVSGLEQPGAIVAFEMTDACANPLARDTKTLEIAAAEGRGEKGEGRGKRQGGSETRRLVEGTAPWRPPVPGPGFYRIRAAVEGRASDLLRREITLAVIRPQRAPVESEFGWSLTRGNRPLSLASTGDLLSQAGVRLVKYPLWLDTGRGESQPEELAAFLEQLSRSGIPVVGTLDLPPKEVLARFDPARPPSVAEVFGAKREVWYPSLERVMVRLGTQVRWWQLGCDEDMSFVGYPDLKGKIAQIKTELDRVGYDLNVGMAWNWRCPLPKTAPEKAPWRFVSLMAEPPLTARELATSLPNAQREQVRRYVVLKPLARREYGLEDRAVDLVQRMLAAKVHGAAGIFASDPFHSEHGLMNDDGTPGELFLPWRTTALVLAGAKPLESIRLPQGSPNHVFARATDAAMIAWNRTPIEETLYLGEEVRQIDLWGQERQPAKTEAGSQLRLGPLPTFVTGMSKPVALWRHGFVLAKDRIPSVFNQRQSNRFEFKNTFDRSVAGSVRLAAPEHWTVRPDRCDFRLMPGETLRQDFELILPNDALSGPHVLQAEFDLAADRAYRFSVYRPIQVGLGDVRIEVVTHLNDRGELEVQQRTLNEGNDSIDFRCDLYAPGRRRLSTQVAGFARSQNVKLYRFSNGRDLIGKTLWLQAQENHGLQVFNYRFVAQP